MPRPTAAFFDLDKTIIAKSSTLAFSREFQAGGLISRGAMLRSAYAQFVFFAGGADHDQMEKMRQFMSQLCAGWDVATVREIVTDTLLNIVEPLVYDEAVSLIEEHHRAGRDVVIVSTRGSEVVEPIGEMLGVDHVIATRMGGTFDVPAIAALDVDDFVAVCSERPAVHRFPGSMGKRVHEVARRLVEEHDGDAVHLW